MVELNDSAKLAALPPERQAALTEIVSLLQALELGRYAIGLSGSHSKGGWDAGSDLDPHLFYEGGLPPASPKAEVWQPFFAALDRWQAQGVTIDGIGVFTLDDVEESLAKWRAGAAVPPPAIWTIWGMHLPTNMVQYLVLDDPHGLLEGWKEQLKDYPHTLKDAVLQKNLASLRYWRVDYHYKNKVVREDAVFLAGLSSKLVHQIIQVIFALNDTYYAGDGNNLRLVESFEIQPEDFSERVEAILYPLPSPQQYAEQYNAVLELIDDLEKLVTRHAPTFSRQENPL